MKGSGITKELEVSEEMADFMGKNSASRAQVMKKIWAYIKKHDLQNEKNRRMIEPDDELATILGAKTLSMFEIAKKLNKHFV